MALSDPRRTNEIIWRMGKRAALCAGIFSVLLFPAVLCAQTQSGKLNARTLDSVPTVTLRGSTHPFALAQYDAGTAPADLPMERMLLVLRRSAEREAELRKLIEQQQTTGSPQFHQWLTPADFGRRFGPADSDVQAVTSWLASNGFRVNRVAAGRVAIEFSGTAGQVRQAFGTEIHKYAVNGEGHWANASDPQIPAALAPAVAGIVSLHNFPRKVQALNPGAFSRSPAGQLTPLFTFAGSGCSSTGNCFAMAPQDFATIYDVAPLWAAGIDGTGQTIAIPSDSNIRIQDVHDFRSAFNLPVNDPVVVLDGPDPGMLPREQLEANFGVQWTGAVAKGATIQLVVSQSTNTSRGVDLSAIYIVENNTASILSENFGECESDLGPAGNAFYMFLWEQAAVEGMTVVVAAGDTGSAGCDSNLTEIAATHGNAVNGVASTPFNVAIGGTDFDQVNNWSQYWNSTNNATTHASAKSYIPETTWNDTCAENGVNGCASPSPSGSDLIAGGGGPSRVYTKPSWQTGNGVPPDGVRDVPDAALFASDGNNGSFYLICQSSALPAGTTSCDPTAPAMNFVGLGGTSGAASAFSGLLALVDQHTNSRQGNANFVLYRLAALPLAPPAFHDIAKGSNSVACVGGSSLCSNTTPGGYGVMFASQDLAWPSVTGFDLVTGLGTPDANVFVNHWTDVQFQSTTTHLTNLTPISFVHGQAVNIQLNVTSAGGTPTGDVALMVSPAGGTPFAADYFTLDGSGSASGSTTLLPGGSYQVFAHYAGDGVFGASDSAPVSITVAAQASQAVMSMNCISSGGSSTYGSALTLRVDVSLTGNPCDIDVTRPTGTLQIKENLLAGGSKPFGAGTYPLNSRGHVEIDASTLPAGSYFLVATYSGDSSYGPSTSTQFGLDINQASPSVTLSASATTVSAGMSITLTATLATKSIAGAPTGVVSFLAGGSTPIGAANIVPGLSGQGFAQGTATLNYMPTGNVVITASYAGDQNYAGTSSSAVNIMAGSPQFIPTGPNLPVALKLGESVTTTLTVTPAFGFTGVVTIACPAPATLPNGLTCAVSPSTLTISSGPATTMLTVSFSAGATPSRPAPLQQSRNAMVPFTVLACALCPLGMILSRRRRGGVLLLCLIVGAGSSLSCASGSLVSSASTLILTSSDISSPSGNSVIFSAAVAASRQVSGTIMFSDGGAPLGPPVPMMAGRASITTSSLAIGIHPVTAAYSGDGVTAPMQSSALKQVISGTVAIPMQFTSGNLNQTFNVPVAIQ